jgi:uncharacterized small protein (DUF1192 family)
MATRKTSDQQIPLTISLTEYTQLQSQNAEMKTRISELQAECERLTLELQRLTDPKRKASALAYKKLRGTA